MGDTEIKLPEDFFNRMNTVLGSSFPDFIDSLKSESPTSIRLNPHKKNKLSGKPVPWCSTGLYLDTRPVFTLDPSFHGGAYYVQEASSMFLEQVFIQLGLGSQPLRILDLSASPGGKSTHIASLMHKDSLLVANEVIRSRASILAENIAKWGVGNVVVTNNDPEDFNRLPGFFDVLVVDAPCSGEGLFRKDPDAITEWSVDNVQLCAKRQRRILNDSWSCLKTNGLLVYCTCTYNSLENEENIQWLSEQHEAESIPLHIDSDWGIEKVIFKNITGYRFFPHKLPGEGFFISVIRKTENQEEIRIKSKRKLVQPHQRISEELNQWIRHPENFVLTTHHEVISIINKNILEEHSLLLDTLHVVSIGTKLASVKGQKLIPEHELALSVELNSQHFLAQELSFEQAIHYLRKETVVLPEYKKGYTLATYQSIPLGWMHVLDNRVNNLYPKALRIRMKAE
ncbi:MAG: rRNA methyltransferase [Cyclobacteriaceae bacterium]|nr:rRNA methyltransferase [Cyclobacteriaceae bacterium]